MVGFDAVVRGEVVVDSGFTNFILVDPVSVLTSGFLFACNDIWVDPNLPLVTAWAADSTPSTTWTNANPSITTIWAPPTGGIYGDC